MKRILAMLIASAPLLAAAQLTISSPNYGINVPTDNAKVAGRRGLVGAPVSDQGSVIVGQLRSSKPYAPNQANAAVAGLGSKHTMTDNAVVQGGFFEAVDYAGWPAGYGAGGNNFVEGIRSHGIVAAQALGGSAYGAITMAGADPGVQWKYLVGIESEVINNTDDPPGPALDPQHFSATFLASSRGARKVGAAYAVNPFTDPAARFKNGFLVSGASVEEAGFAHMGSSVVGLSLGHASLSYAAIVIPNNKPIYGTTANGQAHVNVAYVDTSNATVIGGWGGVKINVGGAVRTISVGPPDSGGPGRRMLTVEN